MRVLKNLANLEKIIAKKRKRKKQIREQVARILKEVKEKGEEVVLKYTQRFDKVKLKPKELRVTESEISAAFNELNSQIISAIKTAIESVYGFHKALLPKPFLKIKKEDGKILGIKYVPLRRVGIYVPAGSAPLVSSVYMCAIPAQTAGVKEIVLVSPPTKDKSINPFILATASLLKIKEIYKIGGAQAIAVLAYGTRTIKKVDKIIGPGNEYVMEAKKQVFGEVDIDLLAGPSEVLIIASKNANLDYILSDLEAQAEHYKGLVMVVTTSKKIANNLRKKKLNGFVVRVRNLEEAVKVANIIAPEHVEIFTKNPTTLLKKIENAGAVFLGENTPVALGDYLAGPSHVLPTHGTAKFFSGLSVKDFLKEIHFVSYSKKALEKQFPALLEIASLEGMKKHIESVEKRLNR
ncbi:MAG: histidinol dehydrogenase [Candidatus Omnitrophica bacterium 4484_70.1]|nr:MAG: histidinol dehydrogenase [Candidatus Omnitrophica bacterium 4484_70.1]